MLEPLAGIVDTALIGRIDTNWLASLAIATTVFNSFSWVFNFLVHASTQSVSNAFGEGSYKKASEKAMVALLFALVLGIGAEIIVFIFKDGIYSLAGASESMIPQIDSYFYTRLLFYPLGLLFMTILSILRGLKRVKVTFYIVLVATLSNVLISWILIYKLGMGLKGAAIGTVVSQFLGVLLSLIALFSESKIRAFLWPLSLPKERDHFFSFGKSSLNLFVRSFCLVFAFFYSVRVASKIGPTTLSAHQVVLQVWIFSSFFIDGVAITGNVYGADILARGDIKSFQILSRRLVNFALLFGAIFSLVYLLFGREIYSLFSLDLDVLSVISQIWPMIVLVQIVNSLTFIYDGLMFGTGRFSYVRKHMLIGLIFFYLPFAIFAGINESILWVWIGIILLNCYRTIAGFRLVRLVINRSHGE